MAEHGIGQGNAMEESAGIGGSFMATEETAVTLGRTARLSVANDNKRPSAPLFQIGLVIVAAACAAGLIFAILR